MDPIKEPIAAHLEEVWTKVHFGQRLPLFRTTDCSSVFRSQLNEHFQEKPFLSGEIPKMLKEIDIMLDMGTAEGRSVEKLLCKVPTCLLLSSFALELIWIVHNPDGVLLHARSRKGFIARLSRPRDDQSW